MSSFFEFVGFLFVTFCLLAVCCSGPSESEEGEVAQLQERVAELERLADTPMSEPGVILDSDFEEVSK